MEIENIKFTEHTNRDFHKCPSSYFNNTVLAIVLFSSFVDFTIPRVIAILPFYFPSLDLLSQSASGQTTPMPLLVVSKMSFSFFSSAMGEVQ